MRFSESKLSSNAAKGRYDKRRWNFGMLVFGITYDQGAYTRVKSTKEGKKYGKEHSAKLNKSNYE